MMSDLSNRLSTHAGYVLLALQAGAWLHVRRDYLGDSRGSLCCRTYAGVLFRSRNERGQRIGGPTVSDLLFSRYVHETARSAHHVRYSISPTGETRLALWRKHGGLNAHYWPPVKAWLSSLEPDSPPA